MEQRHPNARPLGSTRAVVTTLLAPALVAGVCVLSPAAATAQPVLPDAGSSVPSAGHDTEVSFASRGITFHGSLRVPDGTPSTSTAVLLIPGSGPTDRNGTSAVAGVAPFDPLRRMADSLAAHGVTSLRFDKLGAGATGLGGLDAAALARYTFTDQVDDAAAAAALLAERSGVPTDRIGLVGHSEGGLTSLVLRERFSSTGPLGLVESASERFLDTVRVQIVANLDAAVAAGQVDPTERDRLVAETDHHITSLRSTGRIDGPVSEPLRAIFDESSAAFVASEDAIDPAVVAASVPAATRTLVTCSDKDVQVSCDQVERVRAAVSGTDLTFARFATASHNLGELGPLPPTTPISTPLPPSVEFATTFDRWAGSLGG